MLKKHNVSYQSWGTGSSKTLAHLEREINEGETILVEESGKLYRLTSVMHVRVFHKNNERELVLREDRQEFTSGRIRTRPDLKGSVAEKLKVGESNHENVVRRALEEELGVKYTSNIRVLETTTEETDSPSYPGLRARFVNHFAEAYIDDRDFKPEGYVERQKDKTTYFVWEPKK